MLGLVVSTWKKGASGCPDDVHSSVGKWQASPYNYPAFVKVAEMSLIGANAHVTLITSELQCDAFLIDNFSAAFWKGLDVDEARIYEIDWNIMRLQATDSKAGEVVFGVVVAVLRRRLFETEGRIMTSVVGFELPQQVFRQQDERGFAVHVSFQLQCGKVNIDHCSLRLR